MASKALINFYARLVRKDQMKLEEVEEKLRADVQKAIDALNADEDSTPTVIGDPE